MNRLTLIFFFMIFSFSLQASDLSNRGMSHIEIISETDGVSDLNGIHFIKTFHDNASDFSTYFGGGPVYVTLPEKNDEFPAIHAVAGANYHLSSLISLNAETGFDLIEEILIDDRGDESTSFEESNQIDFSISLGLVFNLNKSAYIKTYYRHHVFDGVFLPETVVDFTGIRLGVGY